MLIGCATAAALFPFVGTIVYMIVRPPEFLDDVRERELEMQAAEARLHGAGYLLCPHCDHEVKDDFLRCPHCLRKLKDPCGTCAKPLDPAWKICPYCEAEIPGVTPPPRRRRRRPAADSSRRRSASRARSVADRSQSRSPRIPNQGDSVSRTLILVKPDAFARGLTGEILARFERKGLKIAALKLVHDPARDRRDALRRARRAPVLRRARRLHHQRAAGRRGAGGRRRRQGLAPADRRHQPAGGQHRLDPRRLRDRGRPEHRPRLGLRRVRRARDRDLVPRAVVRSGRRAVTPPGPRQRLAAAARDPRRPGPRLRGPGVRRRRGGRGRAARRRGRERAAQGAGGRRATATRTSWSSAATRWSPPASRSGASRPTRTPRARRCATSRGGRTRSSAAWRSSSDGERPRGDRDHAASRSASSTSATIDWYVAHRRVGGPRGRLRDPGPRRGARRRIEGDYLNVVGLPVAALLALEPQLQRDFAARAG